MSDSLTFGTWFWLLVPALICLGLSIWHYQREQRLLRRKRLNQRTYSRPHSEV